MLREQVLAIAAWQGEDRSVLLKCNLKRSPNWQPAGYSNWEDSDTRLRRRHMLGKLKAGQGVNVLPSLFTPSTNKYLSGNFHKQENSTC